MYVQALVGSLQNSKGFAAVKKQVAAFSGKSAAPSAPVSKIVELRYRLRRWPKPPRDSFIEDLD